MVFTAKPVEDLPTFGEKLKKAREEAGLTKEKVSQFLNSPIKYLEILEAGEVEKLPADIYFKNFLKRYAGLLGLDGRALAAEYEKEFRIANHLRDQKQKHCSLPVLRSRRFVVTPKFLSRAAGLTVLLLVIGYFFYQLNFLLSPPSLAVFEPASADLAIKDNFVLIKGKTEPGARLTINGQESYIDKEGVFEQRVDLAQGLNIIKIEAVNRFGKSSSEMRRIILQ